MKDLQLRILRPQGILGLLAFGDVSQECNSVPSFRRLVLDADFHCETAPVLAAVPALKAVLALRHDSLNLGGGVGGGLGRRLGFVQRLLRLLALGYVVEGENQQFDLSTIVENRRQGPVPISRSPFRMIGETKRMG